MHATLRALFLSSFLLSLACGDTVRINRVVSPHQAADFREKVEVTGVDGKGGVPAGSRVYYDAANPHGVVVSEDGKTLMTLEEGDKVEVSGVFQEGDPLPGGGTVKRKDDVIMRAVGIGMAGLAVVALSFLFGCPAQVPGGDNTKRDLCIGGITVPALSIGIGGAVLVGFSFVERPRASD